MPGIVETPWLIALRKKREKIIAALTPFMLAALQDIARMGHGGACKREGAGEPPDVVY